MPDKFKNRYRIPSTRLPSWDYSWNAHYFITICTQNREYFFGEITRKKEGCNNNKAKMQLSKIGELAEKYWQEIPHHFQFVKLDAFIVMPDHFHGIIIIDKPDDETNMGGTTNVTEIPKLMHTPNVDPPNVETPKLGVSTHDKPKNGNNIKWKPGTLGVIINQFKRICTINARRINPRFAWQSRYYDHVIRDDKSYMRIAYYIHTNPLRW